MRKFKILGKLGLCACSLLLTLGSCKKDDPEPPVNQPPTAPVLLTPQTGEKLVAPAEVQFSWKKATDPEGDAIVYDLYWAVNGEKDFTLLKADISTNSYILKRKLSEGEYRWKIAAKTPKTGGGRTQSKEFNFLVKIPELTLSGENQIQLVENTPTSITIDSGTGYYTATVKDPNLAQATIQNGKLIITPQASGSTQITLTDTKTQKSKVIFITIVANLTITPNTAQMVIGQTTTLVVKGSGKYQIQNSNASVAKAFITTDNQLIIEAKQEGSTQLTVTDSATSQSQQVQVSVTFPTDIKFSTYPIPVVLAQGNTEVRTLGFSIPDGYRVISKNEAVATASVNSEGDVVIVGKGKGTTQIQLIDVHNKVGIILNVTVHGRLALSTENVSVEVGSSQVVTISNGSGSYAFAEKGTVRVDVSLSDGRLTLTGRKKGTYQIEVKDLVTELKKTLTITVTGVDNLALALSQVTLKEGAQQSVNVTAGSGNYTAQSNNANTTVSVAGSVVTISGVSAGTSQITVTDNQTHQTETINVTINSASAITLEGATIQGTVLKKMDNSRIPAGGHITIPDGITQIDPFAFHECTNLTSITIPNSVTSISNAAFSGTGLTSITIPNSVTSISGNTFLGCHNLTSVTLPNSVTSIGYDAFSNCTNLTSIILPNSLTSIGDGAFNRCTNLTSITIPNSVTSIGPRAFVECTNLTSIILPNSLTSISEMTFYKCTNLTSITLPNSITSIGTNAFWGCTGLTSITLSNSVMSIGDGAFNRCRNLTSITLPNSVTSIGDYAFYKCTNLTSITLSNSLTNIGDSAFEGCTNLTSVTCLATTPPTAGGATLSYYGTVYVPQGSGDAYKKAEGWKYCNIVEQ